MTAERAQPFPRHPTFRKRGEYVNWLLRTYPSAPEILYVAAAGSFELYQQEVARLHREGVEQ